ncbi:MAG: hypothetical protein MK100_03745 [Phycisphaerales bacterium]|nr:hypothetical protein [Phycisphaerales bacterium]
MASFLCPAAAACLLATSTGLLSAVLPQRYVVTELEHPDGNGTQALVPFDINDAGRITGFAFHGFGLDLTRQPFFWEDGATHLVPVAWDYVEGHRLAMNGTAYGIDGTADTIIHATTTGTTPVASSDFGPSAEVTCVTDTGHVLGLDGTSGFQWHASTGIRHLNELPGSVPPTRGADINNSGTMIGTNASNDWGSCRAVLSQGGELVDPVPLLTGATRGMAIDDADRIVLAHAPAGFWPGGGVHQVFLAISDGVSWNPGQPVYTLPSAYNLEIVANDAGVIAGSWDTGNDDPQLFMTNSDGWGAVELDIPPYMLAITLDGISDTGIAFGRFLDTDYVTIGFVATVNDGVRIIGDRLIGSPPLQFYGVARDINASGEMIISWAHNYNYGHWAVARPALPGDVDGDGDVDVSDLLAVVAAWGPQPAGAVCGPDLDVDGTVGINDLLEVLDAYMLIP